MPNGPGNLSWQMPPREDDASRRVRDLERAQREQAYALTAAQTQIGSGGLLVNGGGSITISGTGSLNVGSGALNSAGSIAAGTTITAGGNITSTSGTVSGAALSSTGAISGASVSSSGNVSASGQVISAGIMNSPGTKSNTVTVGYSAVYIDSAGNMGGNTSSRRYKQDITPVQTNLPGFLGLQTYKFRYIAAVQQLGDAAPYEYGLMAEDVVQICPWACFYEADGVTVRGINYDRLVVALLNVVQDHQRVIGTHANQIAALGARLTAAGIA